MKSDSELREQLTKMKAKLEKVTEECENAEDELSVSGVKVVVFLVWKKINGKWPVHVFRKQNLRSGNLSLR